MPEIYPDSVREAPDREELCVRTLYAFVQASAELSAAFGLGLKAFERLNHMAAFHVLRRRNLELSEIASQLGVSRRKVDQLSRLLKDNFFQRFISPDDRDALQRRIEFVLWAQPISASRLKQVLSSVDDEEIQETLDGLVLDGRLRIEDGLYTTTTPERRLVRDDWLSRISGLSHQLRAVSATAISRFVRDDSRAAARTVSMRVLPHRIEALETLYQEKVWPLLVELDNECLSSPDAETVTMNFSICWGPDEG